MSYNNHDFSPKYKEIIAFGEENFPKMFEYWENNYEKHKGSNMYNSYNILKNNYIQFINEGYIKNIIE